MSNEERGSGGEAPGDGRTQPAPAPAPPPPPLAETTPHPGDPILDAAWRELVRTLRASMTRGMYDNEANTRRLAQQGAERALAFLTLARGSRASPVWRIPPPLEPTIRMAVVEELESAADWSYFCFPNHSVGAPITSALIAFALELFADDADAAIAERVEVLRSLKRHLEKEQESPDGLGEMLTPDVQVADLVAAAADPIARKAEVERIEALPMPPHPSTTFEELRFQRAIARSYSLTGEEKERLISRVAELSQTQVDELLGIEEEAQEARALLDASYTAERDALKVWRS